MDQNIYYCKVGCVFPKAIDSTLSHLTNNFLDSIGSIQNEMNDLQFQNANQEGLLRAAKRDNCTLHNQLFELKEFLKLKTSTFVRIFSYDFVMISFWGPISGFFVKCHFRIKKS